MALAKARARGFAIAHKTPFRRPLAGAPAGAMARALTRFGVSSSHPSESMDGALAAWAAGAQNDADHGIATLAPSAAAFE